MAEDKSKNEGEVLGSEEGQDDDDHQVAHSDQLSNQEDPKKVAFTHWLLVFLSFFGMIAIVLGGWFVFATFEGRLQDRREQQIEEQRLESLSVPTLDETVFYLRNQGSAETNFRQEKTEAEQETKYEESIVDYDNNRNPTWQISQDGYSVVYQTSPRVLQVRYVNDSYSIDLGAEITDWVLPKNGRHLALQLRRGNNYDLIIYDLALQEATGKDESYINSLAGNVSKMYYGEDAIVRHASITAPETLSVYRFDVFNGPFSSNLEFNSRRIGQNASLLDETISPDGKIVIHRYVRDGREYLGATSLNSETIRDIYLAPNNNSRVNDIAWARDSRTIAFTENEGGRDIRLVVLDTGPSTWEVIADSSSEGIDTSGDIADSLKWKDAGFILAFVNDGNLYSMVVDDQRLNTIEASGINDAWQYGWYFR